MSGWIIDNFVNFCTRCVTLWSRPLTSWSWTFKTLRVSCVQTLYKIWAKSNNPWLSYRRFSTFRGAILGGGHNWGPNFTKLGEDIRGYRSIAFLCPSSDILLHFQTRVAQCSVMLKTTPNFALFDPLWKLGEMWVRSLYQLLKLYLRPYLRYTFDGYQLLSAVYWY